MKVWIVGKLLEYSKKGSRWDFGGVFSSEEKAKTACYDKTYFMGPAILDEEVPEASVPWDDAYYPKAQ